MGVNLTTKRTLITLAIAALVVSGGAFAGVRAMDGNGGSAAHRADVANVKDVVTQALNLSMQAGIPHNQTRDDFAAATAVAAAPNDVIAVLTPAPQTDAATLVATETSARAAIAKVFDGDAEAKQLISLGTVLNAQRDPDYRVVGAGAQDVHFDFVSVNGSSATVGGKATEWALNEGRQRDTWLLMSPKNEVTFAMTLRKTPSGTWKVHDYTWEFAPGGGP